MKRKSEGEEMRGGRDGSFSNRKKISIDNSNNFVFENAAVRRESEKKHIANIVHATVSSMIV